MSFDFRPSWLCRTANAILVGRIHAEERHPVSRWIFRLYAPVVDWSLGHKRVVVAIVVLLMIVTVPAWRALGRSSCLRLTRGALLYMPTTVPGSQSRKLSGCFQTTDRILKQFPETEHVLGKAGRADSATDAAPLSMLETVITLRPVSQWRRTRTWYSSWAPGWIKPILRHFTPDHISREELISRMNRALNLPGVANAWSMPIRSRVDMLTTGIRTPIGVKVSGNSIEDIERVGRR